METISQQEQLEYTSKSARELVQIVDEKNVPVGACTRAEMRKDHLIHCATYAFIRNSKHEFYVQKRTSWKDYCPSYFDPAPGGVVAAGESYETTTRRENEEEMGIPFDIDMTHLFTFYYEDERTKVFGDAWEIVYDGELRLQPEEVESVSLMTMEEIIRRFQAGEKFTPDSIAACRQYLQLKANISFWLAAQQGNVIAEHNLAICFYKGDGVEQNFDEAFKYFKLAADQGHMDAQYEVALCFQHGKRVEKNEEEALHYFRLASRQGHVEAEEYLLSIQDNDFIMK